MAAHLFLFMFVCLRSISSITKAELERFVHPPKNDASLSFLVVGDWGRGGHYNQSLVAFQMGKVGAKMDIDFVISTGDNFYSDGLKDVNDPAFEESFTQIYTSKSLYKQWYTVLGNHDYRGDVYAQLDPILNMIDGRWVCKRSFIVNAGTADIFFVDTTPFVTKYFTHPKDHNYDWRGVIPGDNYIASVLKDVESALKHSIANWKIVVGHHAIRSVGHHGDTKELIELLLPILEVNDVDFYMNGHDHCLEHVSRDDSHIQYLTSGGGSKAWKGDFRKNQGGVEFYYDGQGFMSVQLTPSNADIKFYDVFGKVLHKLNLSKQLYSAM